MTLRPIVVLVICTLTVTACGNKKNAVPKDDAPSVVPFAPPIDTALNDTAPHFKITHFQTPRAAFLSLLKKYRPKAVGIGELHQSEETKNVLSALVRFTDDLLPAAADKTADLVVETWVSTGACGKVEKQLTREVDEVTQRPAETEDETLRLIKKAVALNIQPHVLTMTCDDYRRIYEADGGTDYLALLELVGKRLGEQATAAIAARKKDKATAKPMTLVYGGALHNDAEPAEMWKDVTFGPTLAAAVGPENYLEVDLVVPEFAAASKVLQDEPWMPAVREAEGNDTALIELGKRSYILVFPKGTSARKTAPH